jgi:hypothetical protein
MTAVTARITAQDPAPPLLVVLDNTDEMLEDQSIQNILTVSTWDPSQRVSQANGKFKSVSGGVAGLHYTNYTNTRHNLCCKDNPWY